MREKVEISALLALELSRAVRDRGGFTVQLATNCASGIFHTRDGGGYAVAMPGHGLRLKLEAYCNLQVATVIEGFVRANAAALARDGVHLCARVDKGYLYLDLSEVVQYESLAAKMTHERGELSYWDFAQQRAVSVFEYAWRERAGL